MYSVNGVFHRLILVLRRNILARSRYFGWLTLSISGWSFAVHIGEIASLLNRFIDINDAAVVLLFVSLDENSMQWVLHWISMDVGRDSKSRSDNCRPQECAMSPLIYNLSLSVCSCLGVFRGPGGIIRFIWFILVPNQNQHVSTVICAVSPRQVKWHCFENPLARKPSPRFNVAFV